MFVLNGGGLPRAYLAVNQNETAAKLALIIVLFGIFCITTGKISMALTLLRILVTLKDWRTWFLYFSVISVSLSNLLYCVFLFVQCQPLQALWVPAPGAKCWNPKVFKYYSLVAFGKSASLQCSIRVIS